MRFDFYKLILIKVTSILIFMKQFYWFVVLVLLSATGYAQNTGYWQQKVDYKMDVIVDAKNYQYNGKQTLVYSNNSPDTLHRVFFHLFGLFFL